jgi:hypothetical protein
MEQQLFDAIKAGKADEVRSLVEQNPLLNRRVTQAAHLRSWSPPTT